MRVNPTKIALAAGIPLLCCLASLSVIALIVSLGRYENLLFVFSENIHTVSPSIQKLEQVSEDEFLITYEISMSDRVKINAAEYPVTVIGTNSYYPHLMGYVGVEGAFFSKTAWDGKQKHAVLNKTAAFALFGSYRVAGKTITVKGEPWLITGVLADGDDENSIAYVPSNVTGGNPKSLAVLLAPDKGIGEAYAKNVLKTLGVHDTNYRVINADKLSRIYAERVSVAVMFLLCALFACACPPILSKLNRRLAEYRKQLRHKAMRDIIIEKRSEIIKEMVILCVLAALAAIVLVLLLRILVICMGWRDTVFFSNTALTGDFRTKIALLKEYHQLDKILFGVLLALTGSMPVLRHIVLVHLFSAEKTTA